MKTVYVKNSEIFIDEDDYELVSKYNWRVSSIGYVHGYRRGVMPRKDVLLHRLIMGTPNHLETDHINRNKLDNRKANLRFATRAQNKGNTGLLTTNTSGYKGVSTHKGKWQASIRIAGRLHYLGRFDTPQEAALAYDKRAIDIFGSFARLNLARPGFNTVAATG